MPNLNTIPTYDAQSAESLLEASHAFSEGGLAIVRNVFPGSAAVAAAEGASEVFRPRDFHLSPNANGVEIASHHDLRLDPDDGGLGYVRNAVIRTGYAIGALIAPIELDKKLAPVSTPRRETRDELYVVQPGGAIRGRAAKTAGHIATTPIRGLVTAKFSRTVTPVGYKKPVTTPLGIAKIQRGTVVYIDGRTINYKEKARASQRKPDIEKWNLFYLLANAPRNRAF